MIAKLIPASNWKYTKLTYYLVFFGWAFYAVLTFLTPSSGINGTRIPTGDIDALRVTIIAIILAIMLLAARGATAFKSYATMITGSKEAQALDLIANGLLLTLSYFLISTTFSALLPFYTKSPGFDALIVIKDHIPAFISLGAFFLLYRGSDHLRRVANFETWTRGSAFIMIGFLVFAFVFVLEFTKFQAPPAGASTSATAMTILSPNILLFTLILPFLVAWFLGILATINITKFANSVQGTLYKRALKDLIKGLWFVIVLSMLIQALSLSDKFILSLQLPSLVALIYLLLIFYGIGFMFVRAGAKRLASLEEAG